MRLLIILLAILPLSLSAKAPLMSALVQVKSAPALALPDLSGKLVNLTDYRGQYVLINFWAYWCAPCLKEFPALEQLHQALGSQGLAIVAIHAGPLGAGTHDFLAQANISFQILVDQHTALRGWKVPALPYSYLVDPQGKLVYQAIGVKEWDISAMKKLIKPAS